MSSQNGRVQLRQHGSLEELVILTAYEALKLVKQAMVELRQLNSELQAQNEELEAFAHTVAHQLKNLSSLITLYS